MSASIKPWPLLVCVVLLNIGIETRAAAAPADELDAAVLEVLRQDPTQPDPEAIAKLQAFGQPGLDALIQASTAQAGDQASPAGFGESPTHRFGSHKLIDAVAAQRDAHASGLFWYTDFDEALAEARRSDRPILSLRLLGRLDTDLSCANSRFFRTVLYADTALSQTLREDYVLHWQTVRPVPVITIDMGDGRTIERTITGNSAHYVLDTHGRVVDVLPGLYAPRTFERLLGEAGAKASEVGALDDEFRRVALAAWHAERGERLDRQLMQWGVVEPVPADDQPDPLLGTTIGKSRVELPLVREIVPQAAERFTENQWQQVAMFYAEDSRLDGGSQNLMRSKMPAEDAGELARSKLILETPFMRTLRNLQASIALDTARNEHDLHRRVHGWFAAGQSLDDLATLNVRVYDDLFLMPEDDPWLGLVPADTYAALDGGGLTE